MELLSGYRRLFDAIAAAPTKAAMPLFPFSDTVRKMLLQLAPVVSDGVTTENLMMLRTRFLMEAERLHAHFLGCPLFAWQLELLKSGWFDIGTEWLFGKAEDPAQFAVWTQFHSGAIDSFTHILALKRPDMHPLPAFLGKPTR